MASFWTIKEEKTDEKKTICPWEEAVSNGDKHYPDPDQKSETDKE